MPMMRFNLSFKVSFVIKWFITFFTRILIVFIIRMNIHKQFILSSKWYDVNDWICLVSKLQWNFPFFIFNCSTLVNVLDIAIIDKALGDDEDLVKDEQLNMWKWFYESEEECGGGWPYHFWVIIVILHHISSFMIGNDRWSVRWSSFIIRNDWWL